MNDKEGHFQRFKQYRAKYSNGMRGWLKHTCMQPNATGQWLDWIIERDGITDVNERDSNGFAPLHYAVMEDNVDCLHALLRHGATLETLPCFRAQHARRASKERSVRLPIEYAIVGGKDRCLRRLIEAGSQTEGLVVELPQWAQDFVAERKQRRLAACIVLVSHRRGALRGQERNLVRIIAQLVWFTL